MTAELETLVVAAYVFATSLSIPRPGPRGLITDQELIALAVAQAVTGLASDRQFLGMVRRLLPGWFSHLPEQTQFNRRLRRLTPQITRVQLMVAELVAEGQVRLVDGTLISCANYPGCAKRSDFAPDAAYGYCPSKKLSHNPRSLCGRWRERGFGSGWTCLAGVEWRAIRRLAESSWLARRIPLSSSPRRSTKRSRAGICRTCTPSS